MTSSIEALRRAQPQAEIHALVPATWASVLDENPNLARIWTWNASPGSFGKWRAMAELLPALRGQSFDACVNFHASGTSALLSKFSGAQARANHFHGHADANRYSTAKIPGKGELKPTLERDLDALRALNLEIVSPPPTRVYLNAAEREDAASWLRSENLPAPLLAIGLGASRSTKIWPIESFAKLAGEWIERSNGSVVALAGPKEFSLATDFLAHLPNSAISKVRVRQDLGVRGLAALLSKAKVFVGNDSGPKHLAVAVETPTITLFGPENPFEWHPYDRKRHPIHFVEDLPCRTNLSPNGTRWCGIPVCVVEKHRCMTQIEPVLVLESCLGLLPNK